MEWNLAPEWIAGILLVILILFSKDDAKLGRTSDIIFKYASYAVLCAIIVNIGATYMIYSYEDLPYFLVFGANTLYYCITPLPAVMYLFYTVAIVYDYSFGPINKKWHWLLLPYVGYILFIVINIFTKYVFDIAEGTGYIHGRYQYCIYI